MNPDQALVSLGRHIVHLVDGWPAWVPFVVGLLLSVVPLVVVFPGIFALTTWLERKGLARLQGRIGPNRAGPLGLLQPMADGIKMLLKEVIWPRAADPFLLSIAPVLVLVPAMVVLALIPFGRNMTAAPVDTAVILFFAIGGLGTLGVFLAGWSSRNKYALLGGMRALSQMVSYELPLVLAAVPAVMMAGSLATTRIVESQQITDWVHGPASPVWQQALGGVLGWNIWTPWGLCGFFILFVASLAECNRAPFDLPEADSELVAGHLTEYSGFKYALFFMAEYINAFALSGLAITLYLGGWNGPNIRPPWIAADAPGATEALLIPGFVWFFLKLFAMIALMIWIRGSTPRLRSDQLMAFCWKFLLPLALCNILVTGFYRFVPWYVGWPVSLLVLGLAFEGLGRFVSPAKMDAREYRYA
ncbi:MAG TPA: NADH-quinone oxidoreductase subunit NuoH [Candidatus Methylacidiphilales bacterium]|nr:NADH-quinone oxidoreductase subunit NuoH [Candidatus Methylacidiphilales bacterium]